MGDNCTFGWDSTLIGKIKIGHNCKIGAKAFVNKAFEGSSARRRTNKEYCCYGEVII
ncbi:hypothetical protein [Hungatella hathewayi]|uniref:hypothetical protein n=1 Tax=Hungatella hathewayi TaxID=154046 RepID=UPI0009BE09B7